MVLYSTDCRSSRETHAFQVEFQSRQRDRNPDITLNRIAWSPGGISGSDYAICIPFCVHARSLLRDAPFRQVGSVLHNENSFVSLRVSIPFTKKQSIICFCALILRVSSQVELYLYH